VTPGDVEACDALCREMYKVSRQQEVESAPRIGFNPLLRERGGQLRGYVVPGIIGHAVAETEDDMLALLAEAARAWALPAPLKMLCPLTEGSLFRRALAQGHRLTKMMNLMTLGPYEAPEGVWMPSVLY